MRILSHQRFHQLHHPAEDFRLGVGCAGGVGYYEVEGLTWELRAADLEAGAATLHHIFQTPVASRNEGEKYLSIAVDFDAFSREDRHHNQLYSLDCEVGLDLVHRFHRIRCVGIDEHRHLGDVGQCHQRGGNLASEPVEGQIDKCVSHLPSLSVP